MTRWVSVPTEDAGDVVTYKTLPGYLPIYTSTVITSRGYTAETVIGKTAARGTGHTPPRYGCTAGLGGHIADMCDSSVLGSVVGTEGEGLTVAPSV
jgi:hypothetical protein